MTKGDDDTKPAAHRPVKARLRKFAKSMRHEPTDAEAKMWRLLRDRRLSAFKFRRQVPLGSYILDFVCFEHRFVVEIDGSQHVESSRDEARSRFLNAQGFEIARYWNNDVLKQPTAVLEDIFAKLTRDGRS
jgi:very-short-patch-repair endonuclease